MTLDDVRQKVEAEGFEYAFISYSSFSQVNDAEFHRLREAYIKAQKALAAYIGVES